MKIKKKKHPIYVSIKFYEAKLPDLLLIGEEGNRHYVLVKDLNIFIYNNTLHSGRKHFCRYSLQALSTELILKRDVKDGFKNYENKGF